MFVIIGGSEEGGKALNSNDNVLPRHIKRKAREKGKKNPLTTEKKSSTPIQSNTNGEHTEKNYVIFFHSFIFTLLLLSLNIFIVLESV